MLGRLRERGDTLVLATSKPEPFAVEILEHYDLDRFFSFVAGGTMDDKRSAKGDVLAYALSAGGREGAVMVGDRARRTGRQRKTEFLYRRSVWIRLPPGAGGGRGGWDRRYGPGADGNFAGE